MADIKQKATSNIYYLLNPTPTSSSPTIKVETGASHPEANEERRMHQALNRNYDQFPGTISNPPLMGPSIPSINAYGQLSPQHAPQAHLAEPYTNSLGSGFSGTSGIAAATTNQSGILLSQQDDYEMKEILPVLLQGLAHGRLPTDTHSLLHHFICDKLTLVYLKLDEKAEALFNGNDHRDTMSHALAINTEALRHVNLILSVGYVFLEGETALLGSVLERMLFVCENLALHHLEPLTESVAMLATHIFKEEVIQENIGLLFTQLSKVQEGVNTYYALSQNVQSADGRCKAIGAEISGKLNYLLAQIRAELQRRQHREV